MDRDQGAGCGVLEGGGGPGACSDRAKKEGQYQEGEEEREVGKEMVLPSLSRSGKKREGLGTGKKVGH